MANHRMFSNRIANSAKFLQMPAESQMLYFHMILRADDDGVVESYPLIKLLGVASDNFKVLAAKGYIKQINEDQVVVIMDWLEHNTIRADRKVNSIYLPLLRELLPELPIIEPQPRADSIEGQKQSMAEKRGSGLNVIRYSGLPQSFNYKIKAHFIGKECPLCHRTMNEEGKTKVSIQHCLPISMGGNNEIENIAVICFSCNMATKTKDTGKLNNDEVRNIWLEMNGQSNDRHSPLKISKDKLSQDKLLNTTENEEFTPNGVVNKKNPIQCDKSPTSRHNFPITGSECLWCKIPQDTGRKFKRVREFKSIGGA